MSFEPMQCQPIGLFHGASSSKYDLPRQPQPHFANSGTIELFPHCNFEAALQDLEGFERIWVIFWFHKNTTWKPKVLPPKGGLKRGVFATRSPHRPNPIGLSCVRLLEIKKRSVIIHEHDLLDGTPILDIKPYVPFCDAFQDSKYGWIQESKSSLSYTIEYAPLVMEQHDWLLHSHGLDLLTPVSKILEQRPYPYPNNRIKKILDTEPAAQKYILAYKTWRLVFSINEEKKCVFIQKICSGYESEKELFEGGQSWSDFPIHQAFLKKSWDMQG